MSNKPTPTAEYLPVVDPATGMVPTSTTFE